MGAGVGKSYDVRAAGRTSRPDDDAYHAHLAGNGEPAWVINVEGGEEVGTEGATAPGYPAFRRTPDGPCLLALDWVTIGTVG